MASETYRRQRDLLELARGFMPHNPVEARLRVADVVAQLERANASRDPELQGLLALAQTMLAAYGRAAEAWQAENARRRDEYQARQRAVLAGHGNP